MGEDGVLDPEILKPFLLDDDPWVRRAVASYFSESWSQDEELVPLMLTACDRFGYVDSGSSLYCCRNLPLSPTTFDRVLHLLTEAMHDNAIMHLSSILAHAPVCLLRLHETAVLDNKNLLESYRLGVRHRLDLMPWNGEQLWQELQDLSQRYESDQDSAAYDSLYDDAVIDALALHDVPDTETICRLLADTKKAGSWLNMFLADLAGFRRLNEAIPPLLELLHEDDGSLVENCPQALARIGHPDIARQIRHAYPTASWSFKEITVTVLGEIKHPEAEEAVLTCLDDEDDIEIRTELCHSLCRLFSERGVEVVRRQIHDGYERWIVSLEEVLLPVIKVLGIELPEAGQWRKEREEREEFQRERRLELDELGSKYDFSMEQGIDPFGQLDSPRDAGSVVGTTYRRHDDRVGRNEPCPCGGGKKYKKCCEAR